MGWLVLWVTSRISLGWWYSSFVGWFLLGGVWCRWMLISGVLLRVGGCVGYDFLGRSFLCGVGII